MTDVVPVPVRQLDPELPLPAYAHPGDAGADLVAAADVELPPGGRALVPTGVAIALPEGYVGLVHPRSGLAARLGVTVLNAPGTVDAGYRGEILVNLINHDRDTPAKISRGDRIAQLVVQRVAWADFRPVPELPASRRGTGGHGSTGGHAGLVPSPAAVGAGGGQGAAPAAPDGRRVPDAPERREERDRAGGRTEEVAG
ncbi:dUTP diphosphatase [Micromonospora sp. NPDC048170]|uniref:dUTP diphosphatase n=1 Tax=Micromonospora sp. NPDC048170 TaxID=3154819 RepID=UPI0033DB9575